MFHFLLVLIFLVCFTSSSTHHHLISATHFKNKYLSRPKTRLVSFLKRVFSLSTSSMHTDPSPSSSTISINTNNDKKNWVVTLPRGNDRHIHPCTICEEVFQIRTLLRNHQSENHPISELSDGENIVRIIFNMGWPKKSKSPTIHRILKIHNRPKTMARFLEYRERVKSRVVGTDERCIADDNELLRFYCTTFTCDLGSGICKKRYCNACGVIRSGFKNI